MEKAKTIFKRTITSFLALVMIIAMIPTFNMGITAQATSKTSTDAVNWANAQVGKSLDYDKWYGAQCVDYIKYYYNYLGVTPVNGNGCDYATNSLPTGWQRIKYYSGFSAKPGDIAVWTYASSAYGHVAIVTNADKNIMYVNEQNGSQGFVRQHSYRYTYGTFYGVIRPNFSGSGSSQPSISYSSIENGDYYLKCNSSGQYLAVSEQKDANGQPITLWNKSSTFRVNIKKETNGYIMRFPGVSSSRVVNQYADAPKNGTKVTLYNYSGSKSQSWGFQAVSGGYVIRSMYNSNLCLTGNGTGTVTVTNYTGASNQIWSLEKYSTNASLPNDFYAYIIKNDGWKHIENRNNNVQIAQNGNDSNDPKQIWHFVKTNDIYSGAYKIINEYDGTLLNVDNGGSAAGTNATSWTNLNNKYQRWYIQNSSNGTFKIVAPSSNLCIDAASNGSTAGTNIQLYTDNGTPAQQFKIYYLTNDNRTYSKPAKPDATKVTSFSYDDGKATLKWNASPLKSSYYDKRTYTVRIYSDNTLVKTVANINSTSCTVKLDPGIYSVKVTAVNTKYSNYSTTGESVPCAALKFLSACSYFGHISPSTETTAKATTSKNGTQTTTCQSCGEVISTETIAKISSVKLSATSYTYNGKVKTPTVTVKDANGKTLKKDTDYTVKYSSGRKNVGQYTVTITFKGNYSGSKKLTFKIVPKGTSISKLTAGKGSFTAKWNKQTTQTTGYQVQYSTSSKMSNAKAGSTGKNTTTSATVKKLKNGTTYYVRIRTYKTVKIGDKSTRIYSSWSSVKKVKTK